MGLVRQLNAVSLWWVGRTGGEEEEATATGTELATGATTGKGAPWHPKDTRLKN